MSDEIDYEIDAADVDWLGVADVGRIAEAIQYRQTKFPDEDFTMSVGVVLMNYGDKHVRVSCVAGEWSGTKADLTPAGGLPHCPNGHVLLETSAAPRLALVDGADW